MGKLLYVKASPRTGRSYALAAADAFVAAYSEANPDDEIATLDLFKTDLPAFDGVTVQAKYAILHGEPHTAEQQKAWKAVEAVIAAFTSADKYVFAVPMWNFGIPYRLKHYIDLIVQPGYTFAFTPEEGYRGLLEGKRAFVAYASGGEYAEGSPTAAYDMQKPYLKLVLGFMGITDVRTVTVAPTLQGGADVARAKRDAAMKEAAAVAEDF